MATAKVILTVIGARTCGRIANWAEIAGKELLTSARPTAPWAFHTLEDASEEIRNGHFERNGGIQSHVIFQKPLIEKKCLRQAAGKSI